MSTDYDDLYDSFAHARGERGRLPILPPQAARGYVREVREAVLALLPELPFDDGDPLLEQGFVVGMVVQHELQHAETMAQTLALAGWSVRRRRGHPRSSASGEVTVPGGPFTLGSTRPVGVRQRAARPPGRASAISDRPCARHERGLRGIRRRRRLPRPRPLECPRLGLARGGRSGAAPLLECRRASAAPRPARLLPRGGGVRALGGQASADRARVGEGGDRRPPASSST